MRLEAAGGSAFLLGVEDEEGFVGLSLHLNVRLEEDEQLGVVHLEQHTGDLANLPGKHSWVLLDEGIELLSKDLSLLLRRSR